jgi:hypothetical protein
MLDATPAGERVYRPLGFEGIFKMSRWQGETGRRVKPVTEIRMMAAEDIPTVTAVDAAAFGGNRMFLVESLFRRLPQLAFVTQEITGFVLARPGRIATQIGPIVGANEDAAAALLDAALGRISGPVFLDLIDGRDTLKRHLWHHGFSVQRSFLRMGLNCSVPSGTPCNCLWSLDPNLADSYSIGKSQRYYCLSNYQMQHMARCC